MNSILRKVKKVDKIAQFPELKFLYDTFSSTYILKVIKMAVAEVKADIRKGNIEDESQIDNFIVHNILLILSNEQNTNLKKVLNCTGTVLHTNLGRAKLSTNAIDNMCEVGNNYTNLEFNLEVGKRGSRYSHINSILTQLTGCEDSIVVNNNAAAVMLILSSLSKDKEAVISRGEMVEIGGSFRIPRVMDFGGAVLKEIGTTNKTHLEDYSEAYNKNTGLFLKVHQSNYTIKGFTKEVAVEELVTLSKKLKVPFYYDLGSGALYSLKDIGINEPTVKDLIEAGVDILSFSGDKLLGGPQAGIIVGKKKLIDKLKKNQFLRAIRVDKLTLAALEATLIEYLDIDTVKKNNPTVRMLTYSLDELNKKATNLLSSFNSLGDENLNFKIKKINSLSGGGSLPNKKFPSYALVMEEDEFSKLNFSLNDFVEALRKNKFPIIVRTKGNSLILDLRTIDEEDYSTLVEEFYFVFRRLRK